MSDDGRITSRPKRPLPTTVELTDADVSIRGRAVIDDLALVREDDLQVRRGAFSSATMRDTDRARRRLLAPD